MHETDTQILGRVQADRCQGFDWRMAVGNILTGIWCLTFWGVLFYYLRKLT